MENFERPLDREIVEKREGRIFFTGRGKISTKVLKENFSLSNCKSVVG